LADPETAAQAVIDTLAALPPTALRGRNVFTAWLGEHMAAPARRRFEGAGIPTYDTPEAGVS
jgi:acetyltransferase